MLLWAFAASAVEIRGTGRAEANVRVGIADCSAGCPWVDFHDAAVLGGELVVVFPKVRVVGSADLLAHAGTDLTSLDDAGNAAVVSPVSVKIRRSMVALLGVGSPLLDLELGVDRIRWGTADGLSVVDNMNPYDLEDPTKLDQRLSVPLIAATLHPGPVQIQAVWTPFFVPAVLPSQVDVLAGANDLFSVDGNNATDVRDVESRVSMPEETILEGNLGGRVSVITGPVDFAASWVHGRDSLPQVGGELLLTGFSTDRDRVDVGVPVVYPKIDVGGFEARGELPWEIGGWSEIAVVFPERTVATMSAGQLDSLATLGAIDEVPDPIPSTVTQDGEPLVRAIVGLDRSIGRVYVNVQWLHGFPTERQTADLSDYAIANLRVTVSDHWVVSARAVSDLSGVLAGGEIRYLHGDAAEVWLGAIWIGGSEDSALSGFRAVSNVGTGASVRF